jgi:hypothetical protein
MTPDEPGMEYVAELKGITKIISLESADRSVTGWTGVVLAELKQMRAELPSATELVLRLGETP